MSRLKKAAERAQQWLQNVNAEDSQYVAMSEIGLWFCERIYLDKSVLMEDKSRKVNLTSPISLIEMDRKEILALTKDISLSSQNILPDNIEGKQEWAQIFGGIALSFAHYGDISVVAALVRAAASLNLNGTLLLEAQDYLLDQQQPDGTFGLLDREVKQLQSETKSNEDVRLGLTVEVLWALAQVATQHFHNNYDQIRIINRSASDLLMSENHKVP
ncbi:hypothetical protein ABFG93_21245 (plasmid) [Pseudalkalibacillus hwajinpoensis]|uniref:hypothetical protein n=1 Tax=Guptibacillus hwajinpoensis TaxID=208199 RepID=UPI00325AF9CA